MNRKVKLTIVLFIGIALIQLYIPVSTVVRHELALNKGRQFKFRAAALDPYDPFRGRYVYINIADAEVPVPENSEYGPNQSVYVQLEQDEKGFAKMTGISRKPPETGAWFKARILYIKENGGSGKFAVIRVPFNRYYMEERLAPEAEKAYLRHAGGDAGDVYLTVRVLSGLAVAEKLYIKGVPVEEFLKENS